MIKFLQHTKGLNLFWGLLALFMLNISIDVADADAFNMAEDLSYNEQESIVEYILEEMMGFEDAFPESDDNDASQKTVLKKSNNIDNFVVTPVALRDQDYYTIQKDKYPQQPGVSPAFQYIRIISPPPEV